MWKFDLRQCFRPLRTLEFQDLKSKRIWGGNRGLSSQQRKCWVRSKGFKSKKRMMYSRFGLSGTESGQTLYPGLKLCVYISMAGIFLLTCSGRLDAGMEQRAPAHIGHEEPIPEYPPIAKAHYKSWSLFLICNPGWILVNGDDGILKLFSAYKAFSQAIGPKNLAVWFSNPPTQVPTTDTTDI